MIHDGKTYEQVMHEEMGKTEEKPKKKWWQL